MALLAGRRLESLTRCGLPRHLSPGAALVPRLKRVDQRGWFPKAFGQRTTVEQWVRSKAQHRNTGLHAQKCPIYQNPSPPTQLDMLHFVTAASKEEPTSHHGVLLLPAWDLHQIGSPPCPENLAASAAWRMKPLVSCPETTGTCKSGHSRSCGQRLEIVRMP